MGDERHGDRNNPELTPARAAASGLSPSGMTVLGNKILFEGADASGASGLWASDGTAVGTAELASIAGASSAGIAPSDLTVVGSEALFSGINTSGQTGLWATDGTAAGTVELAGIVGAAAAGVAPTDLTAFGQEALFTGTDAAGNLGLWVTNGTVGGTQELSGVASAASTGLDPTDMTAFNNEALFNGVDINGLVGLWVTDGTVGGTHELVPGAGGASDAAGLNPTNITVYNGKLLFSGLDASGNMGLWVSDGTAAGSHEADRHSWGQCRGARSERPCSLQRRGALSRPRPIGARAALGIERNGCRHTRAERHRRSRDHRSRIQPVRIYC